MSVLLLSLSLLTSSDVNSFNKVREALNLDEKKKKTNTWTLSSKENAVQKKLQTYQWKIFVQQLLLTCVQLKFCRGDCRANKVDCMIIFLIKNAFASISSQLLRRHINVRYMKNMAPRAVFWVDWDNGPKYAVFL